MSTFRSIETEILLRFYRWARKDAEREVRDGYPLLGRIESSATKMFLEYMALVSEEEQLRIVLILLKRVHDIAVEESGELLTDEEKGIISDYIQFQLNHPLLDRQEPLIRFRVPRRALGLPPRSKLRTRDFSRKIKAELAPVFYGSVERHGANDLFYENAHNKWTVQTSVHTGRPPHYFHSIRASWRVVLTTTITSWLGVGDGAWDLLYEDNSNAAAETIAALTDHFLKAVPELLEGLEFDESSLAEPVRKRVPSQASDLVS
jgi:hypothetical protein